MPEYLFIILQSSIVQKQIQLNFIQTTLPKLGLERLELLRIPVIPDLFIQSKIVSLFEIASLSKKQKEAEAAALLASIDGYLLQELGITLPPPSEKKTYFLTRSSQVSGGRFAPFYHRTEFEYLEKSLISGKYKIHSLKEILLFLDYGLMPTQDYVFDTDNGLPMIRVTNITHDGYIDMSDIKYIKFDTPRLYQKLVKENDVLMVQCGNTTGKCALVTKEFEGFTYGSFSFALRGNPEKITQAFLYQILSCGIIQEQLKREMTTATVRPNTSKPDVLNLRIPLPPLEKQTEIANHISAIRTKAKQLQQQAAAELAQAKQQVEQLILEGSESKP